MERASFLCILLYALSCVRNEKYQIQISVSTCVLFCRPKPLDSTIRLEDVAGEGRRTGPRLAEAPSLVLRSPSLCPSRSLSFTLVEEETLLLLLLSRSAPPFCSLPLDLFPSNSLWFFLSRIPLSDEPLLSLFLSLSRTTPFSALAHLLLCQTLFTFFPIS